MEDSHFYKFRSIENDLMWLSKMVTEVGFSEMVPSEDKRKSIRTMMININRYAQTIQSNVGQELRSEF